MYKILDLFCGAGGFSHGFEMNESFKTVVAVDFDKPACETFQKNHKDAKVVTGDITDDKIKESIINISRCKDVNMIIGGPPCQGYSLKGKKLGLEDPRNFLFKEYMTIVKELQPQIFVIENVKNILNASNGWFKEQILNEISNLGYNVEYGVLNAKNFGVPQSRERAFFICTKEGSIKLPEGGDRQVVTVRDAISDLSYLESGEGDFKQEYKIEPQSEYQKLMRAGSSALYNHKASNHKPIAIDKLKLIPPEKGKECLPKEMLGK